MLGELETLRDQTRLTALDVQFAQFVAQRARSDAPELVLAACLASHETGNGHICVDLAKCADQEVLVGAEPPVLVAPDLGHWTGILRDTSVVGSPGGYCPLVLDDENRLYLYRYWKYERLVANGLIARSLTVESEYNPDRLRRSLSRLFGPHDDCEVDWQEIAGVLALLRRLCVISGGPGTGKTTTVVRILALLLQHTAEQRLRIAMATPTGKAATRMQEAVRLAKRDLDPTLAAAIPDDVSTIHRLLGPRANTVSFRHNRANPLALDVLVVDEASMIDLALMAKLVEALPGSARLILLGDKDQLASVEAGSVLGDICGTPCGFSETFSHRLAHLTGQAIPAGPGGNSRLRDSVVLLRRNYRFASQSGIATLARAVREGRADAAMDILAGGQYGDLAWYPLDDKTDIDKYLSWHLDEGFFSYLEHVKVNAEPSLIFAAFKRFRMLSALRKGPFGVETLNALISQTLADQHRVAGPVSKWYPGYPVMITRNDYDAKLYNGDVGIALADPASGQDPRVFFEGSDGQTRKLSPLRLPAHEAVFAMTVHKSQGSEFENVSLLLPSGPSPVLTRELLYTAITRARKKFALWGNEVVFGTAVTRAVRRSSGLRDALHG